MIRVADLHCDTAGLILNGYSLGEKHRRHHIDLLRMQAGQMGLQVFANFVKPYPWRKRFYPHTLRMLSALKSEIARYPDSLRLCLAKEDFSSAPNEIRSVFGIEGGHHLDGSLERILELFEMGVRVFTLTWNNSNFLGVSCKDPAGKTKGLTETGRSAVKMMNRLGMAVDLSHAGERTFWDTLAVAQKPPFASHSCSRFLRDTPRNLSNEQAKELAAAGGIIGVCFFRKFLRNGFWPLADLEDLCRHVMHLCETAGSDHIALGADFDGMKLPARGIPDVSRVPLLAHALGQHGVSRGTVEKIFFKNAINYLQKVLPKTH